MRRILGLIGPILLVLGSLLFCWFALEIGLRVAGVEHREARLLCLDPIIGNVYCAGVEARLDNLYGSTQLVQINSEGMADREHPRAKPPGTLRIALLGDSVTASLYLPTEAKFGGLWEKALSQRLRRPVEVLNFAVDGSATWDQLQLFHLRARHFQPDLVVLGFFWGNDVWNNEQLRDKRRENPLADEYPEPTAFQRLRIRQRAFARWLWNHSYAYQFLRGLQDRFRTLLAYRESQQRAAQAAPAASEPSYDPGFAWSSPGWVLTRQLLVKLKQEADGVQAPLAVLQLPMLPQLQLPKPLPYAELRAFLAAQGIASLDAFDVLQTLDPEQNEKVYMGDRTHLTREGHRLFAEATLGPLESLLKRAAAP